jgi:hypothetical protein
MLPVFPVTVGRRLRGAKKKGGKPGRRWAAAYAVSHVQEEERQASDQFTAEPREEEGSRYFQSERTTNAAVAQWMRKILPDLGKRV